MTPHHFSMEEPNTVAYYSINEPTLIESAPRQREVLNIMQVTRDVKELFERFRQEVLDGQFNIENTPIYEIMKKVDYDFFHSDFDPAGHLQMSNLLPKDDLSLIKTPNEYGNRSFCDSSSFLRGCIRLKTK